MKPAAQVFLIIALVISLAVQICILQELQKLNAQLKGEVAAMSSRVKTLGSVSKNLEQELDRTNSSLIKANELSDYVETRMREVAEALNSDGGSRETFEQVEGVLE